MNKLLAPNGKPSNLTPEQYKLVRTPAFKKWFGYWDLIISGKSKNYQDEGIREICHLLKKGDLPTIKNVAKFLSKQVSENDILIPMPSRKGCVTDNHSLLLSNEIAKISGARVYSDLCGDERDSLYDIKKQNINLKDINLGLFLKSEIPLGDNYFIVDNVIGTGFSMYNAQLIVGNNAQPLVYAVDDRNISKVVDENTEPLVFYHGSRQVDEHTKFNIFNIGNGAYDKGIYFTSDKKEAFGWALGNYVYEVFLNIKNPFVETYYRRWNKGISNSSQFDGILIMDLQDISTIVAFKPEQIKLADGTNTTFDSNNLDIRFDGGGEVNKKLILDFVNQVEAYQSNHYGTFNRDNLVESYHKLPDSIKEKIKPITTKNLFRGADGISYKSAISFTKNQDYAKMFGAYAFPFKVVKENKGLIDTKRLSALLNKMRIANEIGDDEGEIIVIEPIFSKDIIENIEKFRFENGGLIAPNGKPSNLTPEQYELVRSPEFKAWFGDWQKDPANASKVVDENGEPLVCYHGTASDFNIFKIGITGGIFFTNNKNSAERFSSGDLKRTGSNPKILNCFLNIKKYYDKNTNDEILVDNYYQDYFENRPFIKKQSQKNILKNKFNKYFMDLVSFGIVNEEPLNFLIEKGYDGIIIDADNNSNSYIVFESNQIKLADGTNTTFDSNNPDIRFDGGGNLEKNKNMENTNKNMENKFGKGGKIQGNTTPQGFVHQEQQKYARIGVTDKYKIEAFITMGIQGVNFDSDSLEEKLKNEVENLYATYTDYVISEDSKGIDAFFLADIRQAEIEQEPTSVVDQIKENQQNRQKRLEKVNQLAESQKYTLESWIYYFKDNLYPNEFIYLMFSAILKFNYNLNKQQLLSRTKITTTNITSFSASALAKLYTGKSNELLKDYIEILAEEGQNLVNEVVTIQADGGTWFTFLGKGNANDLEIKENAEKLTAFVQNTKWCTTSYALDQLVGTGSYQGQGGNFYVFAEKTENRLQPEIAIRMNHDLVGEISGTLEGQNISPYYSEIAKRFCRLNIGNNSAEEYIDKLNYNIKVGDSIKRLEDEGMYPTIMEDYLYVVKNQKGIGKGKYSENPTNIKFFQTVNTAISNLPNQFFQAEEFADNLSNLTPNTRYYLGDLMLNDTNAFDLGNSNLYEILGNLTINNDSTSFGQLKKIGGNLIIGSRTIQSFDSIELIGGELKFQGTNLGLTSFGNLTNYGGDIDCVSIFTNVISLGNLEECGNLIIGENSALESTGNLKKAKSIICNSSKEVAFPNLIEVENQALFNKCQSTELPNLQSVGTNFSINGSRIKSFPNLTYIGANADFGNNFTKTTQNIERILGDVNLLNSRISEFTNLKYIKGKIEFKSSLIASLGSLERIDGGFILEENTKLIDLGNLTYIGGICVIKNSALQSLNKLEKIIQFAVFTNSSLKDLGNLESIGGSAYFDKTELKNLGKLKYVGGDTIKFGNRTDLEAEWKRIKSNEIDLINFENENNFETGGELKNQNRMYLAIISLLTRLLELSNEELKNDLQIHKIIENISNLSNKKLNIDDYNQIIQRVENYSKGGQTEAQKEKISEVMREFKQGELKTSYGEKVTNPKQAISIALSEANVPKKEEGGKIICAYGEVPLNMEDYYFSEDSKVELVPLNQLLKFKQFDRYKEPKWNKNDSNLTIKSLEKSFLDEGIKEPLIIEYSTEDNSVLLIEGNHRLQTALNMGCDYLPARVVLRKSPFGKVSKTRSMQVGGIKADEYGYISSDLRPSEVGISGTQKIYREGGIIEGQLHSECNDETGCGRKFQVGDGGHIIEAERDEAVLVADAFNNDDIYTIEGTFSQISSAINVLGGGKNFDTGAKVYKGNSTINIENIQPQAEDTDVDDIIDSGSIIINRRTMADTNKYSAKGTLKQIASLINNYNDNGVKVTDGGSLEKM